VHIRQKPLATEAEWLTSTSPERMLEYVWQHRRRARLRGCRRQLRLFACACCRRAWHLLPERQLSRALQACERYADGLADGAERSLARAEAHDAADRAGTIPRGMAARGVWCAAEANALSAACGAHAFAANALMHEALATAGDLHNAREGRPFTAPESRAVAGPAIHAEWGRHCLLARDIFGNPFRPVTVSPACRTAEVVDLAQAAYEQRGLPSGTLDPTRLAVLADALEEAGCDQAGILDHLRRRPAPHEGPATGKGGGALSFPTSEKRSEFETPTSRGRCAFLPRSPGPTGPSPGSPVRLN
jgi:hypothetical protein